VLRLRDHFRNCSATEAIVVLKSVVLASTVLLGVLACRQPVSIGRGDPNACVPLVALLSQPTAVLALEWMPPNNREDVGHQFATFSRQQEEIPQASEFVLNVPAETRGIAFHQFVRLPDQVGLDPLEGLGVAYILEYTLPQARCAMHATWDAHLSIALEHGICGAHLGNPVACESDDNLMADFLLLSVSDPTGTMSVTGSGRAALENAIESLLGLPVGDTRTRIRLVGSTLERQRKARGFGASFTVEQGVSAKVYVGVSAMLLRTRPGWVCTRICPLPPGRLRESALFRVERGESGQVGVAMAPRGG
jgi:hypothetical protein